MDQAQSGFSNLSELDSSGSLQNSPEIINLPEKNEEEVEEELPTAGGLLREWATVYQDRSPDPGLGALAPTERLQKPGLITAKSWEAEAPKVESMSGHAVTTVVCQSGLSMRDLSEIKALKKPPPPVRMLMEVCCLLFHIEPVKSFDERARKRIDYWEPARRYLLSDPFLLSKLRSKLDIEPAQRAKIQKYFKDPNFSSERVLKCSKAAYELYACVSSLAKCPRESHEPWNCHGQKSLYFDYWQWLLALVTSWSWCTTVSSSSSIKVLTRERFQLGFEISTQMSLTGRVGAIKSTGGTASAGVLQQAGTQVAQARDSW